MMMIEEVKMLHPKILLNKIPPANSVTKIFVMIYVKIESAEKNFLLEESNRFSRNSGVVNTPEFLKIGAINHPKMIKKKMAINSNWATAKPREAPPPAKPIKCSLEMFVAKSEMPIANQPSFLPARK